MQSTTHKIGDTYQRIGRYNLGAGDWTATSAVWGYGAALEHVKLQDLTVALVALGTPDVDGNTHALTVSATAIQTATWPEALLASDVVFSESAVVRSSEMYQIVSGRWATSDSDDPLAVIPAELLPAVQGPAGPQGEAGQGVPVGGTTGQVLTKVSGDDYDTEWADPSGGGGAGVTDLAYTASPTNGVVTSSTGTDATLPAADGTNAGLMLPAQFTKLAGIESGAQVNTVTSVAGRTGAVALAKGDVGLGNVDNTSDADKPVSAATATALSAKEATANKGTANGYAGLDSSGQIPAAQIPAIAITEYLGSVASQSAMLALPGQKGDWCTRSDTGTVFVITGADPSILAGWTELVYPAAPVSSVAGRTGAVTLTSSDLTDTTAAGRALLDDADAAAQRVTLGLGGASVLNVGTTPGTVADGGDLAAKAGAGANSDIAGMSGLTGAVGSPTSLQFGDGDAVALAAGKMWYSSTTGAWNMGMGGGNITQQVGEELYTYGKASAAISGAATVQIVYRTGSVGASGVITFGPTVAGITDPNLIVGVATEDIALNAFGRVTTTGIVRGVDTSAWVDNDTLWYDPAGGGVTNVMPAFPAVQIAVGSVIHAGAAGSGSVQVKVSVRSVTSGNISDATATGVSVLTAADADAAKAAIGVTTGVQIACFAYPATDQSVTSGTWTKVTLGTIANNVGSKFASSRFTPGVAGTYLIAGSVYGYSNTLPVGGAVAAIYKNGSLYIAGTSGTTGTSQVVNISVPIYLSASDYVELWANVSGGTPLVKAGSAHETNFGAFLISGGATVVGDWSSPGPIGATTPSTINATAVTATGATLAGGTVTASTPVTVVTQTWNNAAVPFTAKINNVTNTASAAASILEDWQLNNTSMVAIKKTGGINVTPGTTATPVIAASGGNGHGLHIDASGVGLATNNGAGMKTGFLVSKYNIMIDSSWSINWMATGAPTNQNGGDTAISRDAAGVVKITSDGTALRDLKLRHLTATGRVDLPQYTTATRPAWVNGAAIFDTDLDKQVIGGAAGWEVVTSV